jgi:hypothetical protein
MANKKGAAQARKGFSAETEQARKHSTKKGASTKKGSVSPVDVLLTQFMKAVVNAPGISEIVKEGIAKDHLRMKDERMKEGENTVLNYPKEQKKNKGGYIKKYAKGGGVRKVRS